MLLAIKGSVCWSPSTAPAPRTVLAVLGERLVEMSECGTCQREKACLSCMARTGLSGLMVLGRRSLQMATSHHHCHRVGAARSAHDLRTSHGRVLQIQSWPMPFVCTLARWPQISGEIGGGRSARSAVRGALSSTARNERE